MKYKIRINWITIIFLLSVSFWECRDYVSADLNDVTYQQINVNSTNVDTKWNNYFKFTTTQNGIVKVTVPEQYTLSWNEYSATSIFCVSDSNGVTYGKFVAESDKTFNDNLVFEMHLKAGTYMMFAPSDTKFNISFTASNDVMETENNNSPDDANVIQPNTVVYGKGDHGRQNFETGGSLSSNFYYTDIYTGDDFYYNHADVDYYKVTLPAAGSIYAELPTVNIPYNLQDSVPYVEIFSEATNGNLTSICKSVNVKKRVPAGSYYVKVVYANACEYAFRLNYTQEITGYEIENNDLINNSNELALSSEVIGNIESDKDVDYYHVKITNDCMAKAIFTIPRNTKEGIFNVSVNKMQNGKLVEMDKFTNTTNPVKEGKTISTQTGDYYIVVSAGSNFNVDKDTMTDYSLKMEKGSKDELLQELSIYKKSINKVILKWDKVDGAITYEIYRKSSNEKLYILIKTTNKMSYVSTVPVLGKKYTYMIRPVYSGNIQGADSKETSIKLSSKLSKPVIKVNKKSKNKIQLHIKSMPNASKVYVYEKKGSSGWKKVGSLQKGYYYTFTKHQRGKYSYKIKSYRNLNGQSLYSSYSNTKSIRI